MKPTAGLWGNRNSLMWGVNQPSGPEKTWPDKTMSSYAFGFTDFTLGGRSQGNSSRRIVIRE